MTTQVPASMMVRTATSLIAWYIRSTGCRSWTSFWRVIYVLPGCEHDERLLRHERKHLEQIERRRMRAVQHQVLILLWRMTSTSMTTG